MRAALAESGPSAAQAIRPPLAERFGLAAPSIVAFEIANTVHRKEPRRFGGSPAARAEVVQAILLGIELVEPDEERILATGLLAERFRLTVFDAAYLQLAATREGSVLVTEDVRLRTAARRLLGAARAFDAQGARVALETGKL